jgi:hypothetical protein
MEKRTAEGSTAATFWHVWDKSGRRWFILGVMLLFDMGMAVWAVRRNPLAIAALFIAVAAVLRTVPGIMIQRNPLRAAPRVDAEAAQDADEVALPAGTAGNGPQVLAPANQR